MNRRTFVTGASLAAGAAPAMASSLAAGPAVALAREPLKAHHGCTVRLEGWLSSAEHGPGHYFTLGAGPGGEGLVRVYPADARRMKPGRVTLTGTLAVGRFHDEPTGAEASAVLVNARYA